MKIERDDKTWLYTVEWDDGRRSQLKSVTNLIDAAFGLYRGFDIDLLEKLLELEGREMHQAALNLAPRAIGLIERVKNAGNFGRHVHELTELDDHGLLNEDALDPNLRGILTAWRGWRTKFGIDVIDGEVKLASRLGYAGTLDRIVTSFGDRSKLILVEIKSRAFNPWRDCLQTAAYKYAWEEMTGQKIARRVVVSLNLDGSWKAVENKGRGDMDIFRCALAINQWRENHGQ